MRCHSVTFLKLPEKIALILIPDNPGLFLQSKALYRTTEEPSSEIFFFAEAPENCIRFFALSALYRDYVIEEAILFSGASPMRDGVCFSSRINRSVQSALFCVFQARTTFRLPSKNSLV